MIEILLDEILGLDVCRVELVLGLLQVIAELSLWYSDFLIMIFAALNSW